MLVPDSDFQFDSGLMEYKSDGVLEFPLFHYSNTPSLQYTDGYSCKILLPHNDSVFKLSIYAPFRPVCCLRNT
jgi:hypothetical protein